MAKVFDDIRNNLQIHKHSLNSLKENLAMLKDDTLDVVSLEMDDFSADATPVMIADYVFRSGEHKYVQSQLGLINHLVMKMRYAMALMEFQAALSHVSDEGAGKSVIGGCLKNDRDDILVAIYQCKVAVKKYQDNPYHRMIIDQADFEALIKEMEDGHATISQGIIDPDILAKDTSELIAKIGDLRLAFANRAIGETEIHIEIMADKMGQSLFLMKAWDEGIMAATSKAFLDGAIKERLDYIEDHIKPCEERTKTTAQFMGAVYEMMSDDSLDGFKADRYHPASLSIISKLTP